MPNKKTWLEILESAGAPKKGTKIPKGVDLYKLMSAMNAAGRTVNNTAAPGRYGGGGLEPWNTGAGANGVVEPGKAVMLDTQTTPPSVLHEGERVEPFPGGKKIIPAQTEQEQGDLAIRENKENLPGYATGGTVYNDPVSVNPTTSTRPTNTYDLSPAQPYAEGQKQAFETTKARAAGNDPLMKNISNAAYQDYDTRAAVSDTEAKQYAASQPNLTEGAKRAIESKEKATYRAGLATLAGGLSRESMSRAEAANTELFNMGRTGVQDDLSRQTFEKTFGEQQYGADVVQGNWQTTFDEDKDRYKDSKAWNDFEYTAQYGSDSDVATAYKAATGKDIDLSSINEIREYARTKREQDILSGQLANDAQSLGLNVDTMQAVVTAINNGTPIDTINTQFETEFTQADADSIGEKYRQSITSGDIALDAMRNEFGDSVYASIQTMIDSGSSLSAVNQRLAEQGKRPINSKEFNNMLDATSLGERTWGRQMTAMNMLLSSNDPANIAKVPEEFSKLFPGVDFNVDQLISDIGAEKFATGMADYATLSATFDTWEEARNSAEGLNLIKSMGFDENQAKNLFDSMKVNTIDDEWNSIETSKWYTDLKTSDPDSAKLVADTFTAGLTGELEFDITPVYNVMDGTKLVKEFNTIEEANKFIGDNASKGYKVSDGLNYTYKDMGSGDTVVVNNGSGGTSTTGEDGTVQNVETVAAKFARLGLDYTVDDVQAYYTANGKLPEDSTDMKTWDSKQEGIAYWDRLETKFPDKNMSNIAVSGISVAELGSLISAKSSGDKRADSYFVDDMYVSKLPEYVAGIKSGYEAAMASQINPSAFSQYNKATDGIVQTLNNSVGKLMILGGTPYVVMGTESKKDGTKAVFYNTKTKQTVSNYIDWKTVMNGFEGIVK